MFTGRDDAQEDENKSTVSDKSSAEAHGTKKHMPPSHSSTGNGFRFGDGSFRDPFQIEEALRREDARVEFKVDVFLDEFFVNMFAGISYPWVIYYHGWIGATNRVFFPLNSVFAWLQILMGSFFVMNIVFYIISFPWDIEHRADQLSVNGNDPSRSEPAPFRIFLFEVVFFALGHVLRCATIASKYAFMSRAELGQIDAMEMTSEDISRKLVLVGWFTAPEDVVFVEMERSLTRNTWGRSNLYVVYPTLPARNDALRRMVGSIPSFLRLEGLGLEDQCRSFLESTLQAMEEGDDTKLLKGYWIDVQQAEANATKGLGAGAGMGSSGGGDGAFPSAEHLKIGGGVGSGGGGGGGPSVLGVTEEEAFKTAVHKVNSGEKLSTDRVGVVPAPGVSRRRAELGEDLDDLGAELVEEVDEGGKVGEVDDDGLSEGGESREETGAREVIGRPGQVQAVDGYVVDETMQAPSKSTLFALPGIPLKLVMWHLARTNIVKQDPPFFANLSKVRILVWVTCILPIVVRLALGENLLMFSVIEWMMLVSMAAFNSFNYFSGAAFLILGMFDLWRRFNLSIALHRLLDPVSQRLYLHSGPCSALTRDRQVSGGDPDGTVAAVARAAGVIHDPALTASGPSPSTTPIRPSRRGSSLEHSAAEALVAHTAVEGKGSSHDAALIPVVGDEYSVPSTIAPSKRSSTKESSHSIASQSNSRSHARVHVALSSPTPTHHPPTSPASARHQRLPSPPKAAGGVLKSSGGEGDGDGAGFPHRSLAAAGKKMSMATVQEAVKMGQTLDQGVGKATESAIKAERKIAQELIRKGGIRRSKYAETAGKKEDRLIRDADTANNTLPPHLYSSSTSTTTASSSSSSLSSMSRADTLEPLPHLPSGGIHSWLVRRSRYLSDKDVTQLLRRQFDPIRLDVIGYPANVLAWMTARNVLSDTGRVFATRVLFFTTAFAAYIIVGIVCLFAVFIFPTFFPLAEAIIIMLSIGLSALAFGIVVAITLAIGVRVNRSFVFNRRRINRIESLVQEYLVTPPKPLPEEAIQRLKKTRKLLSLAGKVVESEAELNPARVMGLPATATVLYSYLSILFSTVVFAVGAVSTSSWGSNEDLQVVASSAKWGA